MLCSPKPAMLGQSKQLAKSCVVAQFGMRVERQVIGSKLTSWRSSRAMRRFLMPEIAASSLRQK